jgi:hypothetical protein
MRLLPVETGGYDGTKSAFADCGDGDRCTSAVWSRIKFLRTKD